MAALTKKLYRSLLRTSSSLDRTPWSRCFLIARPDELYDRTGDNGTGVVLTLPEIAHQNSQRLNTLLKDFNGGEFYRPSSRSLKNFVRHHFRSIVAERNMNDLDLGFMSLRSLTSVLTITDGIQAKSLPGSKAEDMEQVTRCSGMTTVGIGPVEQGGLLVTHPTSCLFQPTLHRSVIVFFEVDEHVGGLIVNKPWKHSSDSSVVCLREIITPEAQENLDVFLDHAVFRGGDVMTGAMLCLSAVEVEGGNKICDNLFVSANFQAAAELVAAGGAEASDFKFVVGHCGWTRVQLDVELARNVWFTGEAGDGSQALALGQDAAQCEDAWAYCLAGFGDGYAHLSEVRGSDSELRECLKEVIAENQSAIQEGIEAIQTGRSNDDDDRID